MIASHHLFSHFQNYWIAAYYFESFNFIIIWSFFNFQSHFLLS